MASSRFGILSGELDKKYQFKNDIRKHEIDTKSVKAHINFSKATIYHGIEVVSGTVIDFTNIKNKNTRYFYIFFSYMSNANKRMKL